MENIKTPAERANELYHYGVKGMRWGVRHDDRAKSMRGKPIEADIENGSRKRSTRGMGGPINSSSTPKADPKLPVAPAQNSNPKSNGKGPNVGTLISKSGEALTKTGQFMNNLKDSRKVPRDDVDLSNMSDKELRDRVNRYRLEQEYISTLPPSKVEIGRQKTNDMLDAAGRYTTIAGSLVGIAGTIFGIIMATKGK